MSMYGRIGSGIALGLVIVCSVFVLIGVVALWISGPFWPAVLLTVLVVAVATMLICFALEDHR